MLTAVVGFGAGKETILLQHRKIGRQGEGGWQVTVGRMVLVAWRRGTGLFGREGLWCRGEEGASVLSFVWSREYVTMMPLLLSCSCSTLRGRGVLGEAQEREAQLRRRIEEVERERDEATEEAALTKARLEDWQRGAQATGAKALLESRQSPAGAREVKSPSPLPSFPIPLRLSLLALFPSLLSQLVCLLLEGMAVDGHPSRAS